MDKLARILMFLAALGLVASTTFAGAIHDVWIDTEEDQKRNVIFKLVNGGDRAIYAKVEYLKVCTGVSNDRKPTVREHFVRPGKPIQLAKTWAQTTCRREFRIVAARYPEEAPR